ncbi:TetR/AcrR family transcriptional regulator [Mycoplasmatota bacterium]|nr:TetR/AcrR family transcriptional regulator [Mycoplasmatota bacterium]
MRKLENQKQIILDTAKQILQSGEYQNLSIRKISTECKIGIGTVYNYYKNKTDILMDIIKDFWMNYISSVTCKINNCTSLLDKIDIFYYELVSYSSRFRYELVSKELNSSILDKGRALHNDAQSILVKLIKTEVNKDYIMSEEEQDDLSSFIANNLVALIIIKTYDYSVFRNHLSKIITIYKRRENK